MGKFLGYVKNIKLADIKEFINFFFSLPITIILFPIYFRKRIWLVMECPDEARDNGYHFFKYVRENHTDTNIFYAIDKKCSDYSKIKKYGNIIQVSSIRHFVYYNLAEFNVSTHKNGNPANAIYYVLNLLGFKHNCKIFLQHGITMNNVEYVNYKNGKFRLFVCAAIPELKFIKDNFGYPEENVRCLGFSRFDNLNRNSVNSKQILIMPTWRNYYSDATIFENTDYYKNYNSLLNNLSLVSYIEKKGINIIFYPHRKMHKYLNLFTVKSSNIKILKNEEADIQGLLKESALLITDYSSVSIDFAYMNKPLIYYQFDKEDFRKHLAEGYFSYENNGFGDVTETEEEVIDRLKQYVESAYVVENVYKDRVEKFFTFTDSKNSERIYNELKRIGEN